MSAYYNEHDPFAAAWLRELMADGLIAPGDLDERDIQQVQGDDLRGYTQCHFFAGIGGWSYALRLAGWPDDRHVWSGSCPCQPLSSAGQRKGHVDERHLWPAFHRLIAERRPPVVFGEQVAGALGYEWLAGIRADLEGDQYAVGAADLCAPGVGAPHIRQRIYWLADAGHGTVRESGDVPRTSGPHERAPSGERWDGGKRSASHRGADGGLAHADGQEQSGLAVDGEVAGSRCEPAIGLGNSACGRRREQRNTSLQGRGRHADGAVSNPWRAVLIDCTDGKRRRIPAGEAGEPESIIFPLAYGVPNRMGTLRGSGNAIVPQVAAEFIGAYLDVRDAA